MSALVDDFPVRRFRALRFARPAWERPPEPEPVYRRGARTLPVPAGLAPYVRDERHCARVVAAVADRVGNPGNGSSRGWHCQSFRGDRRACGTDVLALLEDDSPREDGRPAGLNDPIAAELILLLFPPVPCARCGTPFLQESERRVYCGDGCRRAVMAATQAARHKERRERSAAARAGTEGEKA